MDSQSRHLNGASVPRLISLATALPPHAARQDDVKATAAALFNGVAERDRRLLDVFDNAGIDTRHFSMPLDWYTRPHGFREMNDAYVECALRLAADVATRALDHAGLGPGDVDHVVFVSSTGVAAPSLDARLANVLPFRADVRRTPIWGLGCAGGVAGLARARDFALADPAARVLLIALELCTLTFQIGDHDRRNLVATSLFADGAAAAVVAGSRAARAGTNGHRALDLLGARSTLWADTLDVMGWDVDERGLHVVFSRDIPTIVRDWVRPNLEAFLGAHGLSLPSLRHMVAHPGGPKVLAAYREALDLAPDALRHASAVLRDCGNMSSPTCLFVLERFLDAGDIGPEEPAVLTALGPGFASELVLARGAA